MSKRKRNKKKYVLYALELTDENLQIVQDKRFYRITSQYILLYEINLPFTNYTHIGDSEMGYLSDADKQWLLDCNMAIIAEETIKKQDKIAASMGQMLERFEKALQSEKSKEEENVRQSQSEQRTQKS